MEIEQITIIAIIIMAIGLVLGIGLFVLGQFQTSVFVNSSTTSTSQEILSASTATLTPIGDGITSSSVQAYNDTWLDFDGVNDSVLVDSPITSTITFWYNSSTSTDWQFISNVSGTTYVNGTLGTPLEYPIFFNGTHYFIGKTNESTFWEGKIDNFQIYNDQLNLTEVTTRYNEGR